MRIFWRYNREYRYQIAVQEVLEAVQEAFDPTCHLEACKGDLERLVGWGNLTTLHDSSRVSSIADFRSPVLLYQATPEAIEIEAFLAAHAHIGASEGGLHQGDLPRLWIELQEVDRLLQKERSSYTPEHCIELAERWQAAFTLWEHVTNDAAQYLGSMNRTAQHALNFETFLTYKSVVVTYVHSFAQVLIQYSASIRTLLAEWMRTKKKEVLLELVASAPPPIQKLAEEQDAQRLWRDDVERQIMALQDWFARERNVEMFRRAAHDAIEKVVHRAHSLATTMQPQTDYVTMLQNFATSLMHIHDVEIAQRLCAAAFGNALPIHLSEGFTGSPSAADAPSERLTWQAPPTITQTLRPIYKGNAERHGEPPLRRNVEALHQLWLDHQAEHDAHRKRFDHIFQVSPLDIGTLPELMPEERTLLVEIIDTCLNSPVLECIEPDGIVITLLNRDETQNIALRAADGILYLPRYRLQYYQMVRTRTSHRREDLSI